MASIKNNPAIIMMPSKEIAYVNSPLNGCTTVKNIMYKYLGYEVSEPTKIHRLFGTRNSPKGFAVTRHIEAVPEEYFVFSIVRNPFDRLVSFYEAKWSPQSEGAKPLLYRHYKPYNWNLDFPEFTQWLRGRGVENVEEHAMTQYDNLNVEKLDFIVRFERFTDDLSEVFESCEMGEVEIPNYGSKPRKDDYREYYNKDAIEIVRNLYQIDIENLGYSY